MLWARKDAQQRGEYGMWLAISGSKQKHARGLSHLSTPRVLEQARDDARDDYTHVRVGARATTPLRLVHVGEPLEGVLPVPRAEPPREVEERREAREGRRREQQVSHLV